MLSFEKLDILLYPLEILEFGFVGSEDRRTGGPVSTKVKLQPTKVGLKASDRDLDPRPAIRW